MTKNVSYQPVTVKTQDVRDDVGQKQGIEAATSLLYALENRIKTAPQTFSQILDILRHFFLPQELVAQMKEQCEARKAMGTQRPPAQSTHCEAGEATDTLEHPAQSTHHEVGEATGPLRPPAQSTPLEAREATGTQRPPAQSTHHETGEATGAQRLSAPSTHHETREAAAHGPGTPPIQHQRGGAIATHEPPASVHHETRRPTVTQEATGGITHGRPLPPNPGMCVCMYVGIYVLGLKGQKLSFSILHS